MELDYNLVVLFINVASTLIVVGVFIGYYKNKISSLSTDVKENKNTYNSFYNRYEKFKEWVYSAFDSTETDDDSLKKEFIEKINEVSKDFMKKIDDVNKKVEDITRNINLSIKEVERSIWVIENRCASKEPYTSKIPQLTEELNQLKIEVSSLPAKLSNEIAKSFSDEYQKIISVIVSKNNDKKKM